MVKQLKGGSLTKDQIDFYNFEGYLVLPDPYRKKSLPLRGNIN
ncbi:hypothetical protein [Paenibacillus abyssi]|nr:hypothetical protein [Paenibacillus abyssi]